MRKTSGFFLTISFIGLSLPCITSGQDTIDFPMRAGVGAALYQPVSVLAGRYPQGIELNGFLDLNERLSLAFDAGSSRFRNETHNYSYENKGFYFRGGADLNMLNPVKASGRYYAGLSLKYGVSFFTHSVPYMRYENYWGSFVTNMAGSSCTAHFLDVSPGIRVELFRNFFIGWSVSGRLLLWSGAGKHMRAIDIPGFGSGSKPLTAGINYYISIRIPRGIKRVIWAKPDRGEPEDILQVEVVRQ